MNRGSQIKPRLVIGFFTTLVMINWLYTLWVEMVPEIVINSWFVVMPMLGYFYFTFAFIALIGLYKRKQFGVMLAYGVIMFGSTVDVISYNIIYKRHFLLEQLIVPLLAVNLCVIFYIMRNQSYFKGK